MATDFFKLLFENDAPIDNLDYFIVPEFKTEKIAGLPKHTRHSPKTVNGCNYTRYQNGLISYKRYKELEAEDKAL